MARILAVDDDTEVLRVMQEWLAHEKHAVDAVAEGIKGWECLQKNAYDLVILDWDLPDINGIDLLKRFRGAGGATPVIMLTGRSSVDHKAEGLDSGADDYLTKPFHMKELLARIRAALRKAESLPAPKPLSASDQELLKGAELIGTSLAARYEFLDVLGEGAVGIVFKARHPQLDKFVAIKMIRKSELNEEVLARFEQEARAISRLDHPNIATVYDFGATERHQPYMVMEFIEGKGLDQLLIEQGAVPLAEVLEIFIQVCDGMSHAHGVGILHRDLKPSNIMLKDVVGSSRVAKILDFGCAKLKYLDAQKAPALTTTGEVVGSPLYMNPEQIHGKPTDERSEVYSLGCVLYEALTGSAPHAGDDAVAVLVKHVNEEITPLRTTRPDLSFPLETELLIAKTLQKDPDKRYQSMHELKAELEVMKARAHLSGRRPWWHFFGNLGKS